MIVLERISMLSSAEWVRVTANSSKLDYTLISSAPTHDRVPK